MRVTESGYRNNIDSTNYLVVTFKYFMLKQRTRAGSVWIFQIRFGSVFNLRYPVSVFFGFGVCTSPQ